MCFEVPNDRIVVKMTPIQEKLSEINDRSGGLIDDIQTYLLCPRSGEDLPKGSILVYNASTDCEDALESIRLLIGLELMNGQSLRCFAVKSLTSCVSLLNSFSKRRLLSATVSPAPWMRLSSSYVSRMDCQLDSPLLPLKTL
jgi:hypothetical protein